MGDSNHNINNDDSQIFEGMEYLLIESQRSIGFNNEDINQDFNAMIRDKYLYFDYQSFIFKLDLELFQMY